MAIVSSSYGAQTLALFCCCSSALELQRSFPPLARCPAGDQPDDFRFGGRNRREAVFAQQSKRAVDGRGHGFVTGRSGDLKTGGGSQTDHSTSGTRRSGNPPDRVYRTSNSVVFAAFGASVPRSISGRRTAAPAPEPRYAIGSL